ncbi:MAG: HPF/RaiA family ribosome-associated protein [Pseudomonadota bacterium]|nr:HPF/RaiA family ribosome-associated protein [Pseudomonadota bacterium]
MSMNLDITVRDIPTSDGIEDRIRGKAEKLTQYFERIENCKVVVEQEQKKQTHGKLYNVHLDVTVPGKHLVVNKQPAEDLYVAIRDSFQAMYRQLEDYARIQRGDVKAHFKNLRGEIKGLFGDYGFIATPEGTEYYFHESNVMQPTFDQLVIGQMVHFIELAAGETLQAGHIRANGKMSPEDFLPE